jgi:hypothetical protein
MLEKSFSKKKRSGFALLLMILIVIVIGAVMWLDPMSFFQSNDPNLPWNQEFHLVAKDGQVPPTTNQQVVIDKNMQLKVRLKKEDKPRGTLNILIGTNGRIHAGWDGEFYPEKKVFYDVVNGGADGNIAPSKIYTDEEGIEDPSKLYFLTKGSYMVLVSDDNRGTTFQINGMLYVRGWIEPNLHVKGEMIITADMNEYKTFPFEGDLKEAETGFEINMSDMFNL